MGRPTHRLSYTPEYRAWQTMRLRCYEPTNAAYPDYGGRGVTVCERWLNSVEAFVADMGPKPTPRHEIDRQNNDGNYEPGNCRWVLRKVNCRNRRSNRRLFFAGETLTLAEWCERLSLLSDTVSKRLAAGWSVEDALTVPVRAKAPNGHAKPKRHPCIVCGKPVYGARCKSCENRRRYASLIRHREEIAA